MNCRETENLLLAERDGVLTPAQHAALGDHLATCAACRAFQADLVNAMESLRADATGIPVPDADEEWRLLQVEMRTRQQHRSSAGHGAVKWFGAPLAAAAALALAFYAGRATALRPTDEIILPGEARAEFVELADASATPVVFRDEESGWLVVWAESEDPRSHG